MKTIKVILFAAICLIAISVSAQEEANTLGKRITFGIKGGLNISNIGAVDDNEFNNTKAKVGFHVGVTLDYAFTHQWYLLTGLEYTTKGSKIDVGRRDDMNVTSGYLQLPVCAGFKFKTSNDLAILVNLGPYFAYGLHGKTKLGSSKWDTFSKDIAKKFDCGLKFGVGIELQKLYFELGGESGLINIMEERNSKAETRNFTLSMGYKF